MSFVSFSQAVAILRRESIVAFPTETVYGLGAIATSTTAILKIYEIKKRPSFNPLILHVSGLDQARKYGKFNKLALQLAANFWPGPMTLVLPKINYTLSPNATAGLDTIAIRVPAYKQAQNLISAVGTPLVAPSANPSGRLSATSANHVEHLFNSTVPVLDNSTRPIGLESTIIDCTRASPIILRHGAISAELIEKYIGIAPRFPKKDDEIKAPGMLLRHYAPKLPLYLNKKKPFEYQAFITFGDASFENLPIGTQIFSLSPTKNLKEAAATLFTILHKIDSLSEKFKSIAVVPIPNEGIGKAINDRLSRGAHKKI